MRWHSATFRAVGSAILIPALLAACQHAPRSQELPAATQENRVAVALLVPRNAEEPEIARLGTSLENGARLAIPDISGAEIDLRVYSTRATNSGAEKAAVRALEEGADIILGPLYSESTEAVARIAAEKNVIVLSFSNDTEIAGGNVFVLGLTYENSAAALMAHAKLQGKSRPVVIYADSYAGERGLAALREAAASNGIPVLGGLSYERSQLGVVEAIGRISSGIRSHRADLVVFTSDSAGALPLLAQLLPENNIKPESVKFAGLARWDIPPATLELDGLQGGWFPLPEPYRANMFSSRFREVHSELPHPLASLAYDGMAAIGALVAARGASSLDSEGLTTTSGFRGVNGVFRFRTDGRVERLLAVAEVVDRKSSVVASARETFAHAGF
ncbi:MAG: penicillin-binding protein activator [Albidovulum sp.]|nr:penicillin-binding protein activator [Albidovulum sp.]MDE0533985.1 penicillin-binding protein activator [Albidovulum sp.]